MFEIGAQLKEPNINRWVHEWASKQLYTNIIKKKKNLISPDYSATLQMINYPHSFHLAFIFASVKISHLVLFLNEEPSSRFTTHTNGRGGVRGHRPPMTQDPTSRSVVESPGRQKLGPLVSPERFTFLGTIFLFSLKISFLVDFTDSYQDVDFMAASSRLSSSGREVSLQA